MRGTSSSGTISRGLAGVVEKAVSQWGLPNGYILGQEGGVIGGLRYGEGSALPLLRVSPAPAEAQARCRSVARVPAPEIEDMVMQALLAWQAQGCEHQDVAIPSERTMVERSLDRVVKPGAIELRFIPNATDAGGDEVKTMVGRVLVIGAVR